MILCVFTIGLVACGDNPGDGNFSKITGEVYGNGGLSVVKGDYVFFVNGYMSADDMASKNDSYAAGEKVGALVVAKLDNNGEIVLNEDDLLDDEYYQVLSDKLCGFEATSLSIYGDYLYFTSPCQQNDSSTESWAKTWVDFYRVNVANGKGEVERIYQTNVANDCIEFAFYNNNGTYLIIYEKTSTEAETGTLKRVSGNGNVKTVSSDVTSHTISNNNAKNVYYVVNEDEEIKLVKYNYSADHKDESIYDDSIAVKFANDTHVYIERPNETNSSRKELVRANVNGGGFGARICYTDLYTNLYLTPDNSAVVAVKGNYIDYYLFGNDTAVNLYTGEDDETISVIGIANGSVVFIDGNNTIKSISYSNHISTGSANVIEIATISKIDTAHFDIDDEYVYFYKTVGSNKYLHRLAINNNDGDNTEEMLGIYVTADVPKVETEPEE